MVKERVRAKRKQSFFHLIILNEFLSYDTEGMVLSVVCYRKKNYLPSNVFFFQDVRMEMEKYLFPNRNILSFTRIYVYLCNEKYLSPKIK